MKLAVAIAHGHFMIDTEQCDLQNECAEIHLVFWDQFVTCVSRHSKKILFVPRPLCRAQANAANKCAAVHRKHVSI